MDMKIEMRSHIEREIGSGSGRAMDMEMDVEST